MAPLWSGAWAASAGSNCHTASPLPCPQQSPVVPGRGGGASQLPKGRPSVLPLPTILPPSLQRMGKRWLCLCVASPPLHLPRALAPGCGWQTSIKQGLLLSSVPAKHFSPLLLLYGEQRPTQDKRRATRKGEAPPEATWSRRRPVIRASPCVPSQTLQDRPVG